MLTALILAFAIPSAPPAGRWSVDLTGALTLDTLNGFDTLATAADRSGCGQLGLLVTASTGGVKPREYATKAFNKWGVGHAGKNDGLFVFIAIDDRKAEIVRGDGAIVPVSATDQVMRDDIVANMKAGNPNGAVNAAALSLAHLCIGEANAAANTPALAPLQQVPLSAAEARLMRIARGEELFPEPAEGHWVIDLSERLNASRLAELDLLAAEPFSSGKGRLYAVLVESTGEWTSPEDVAEKVRKQLAARSSVPLGIVVWDSMRQAGFIDVPFDRSSPWEAEQVVQASREMTADSPVAALSKGLAWASHALQRGVPTRPVDEVVMNGLQQHQLPVAAGGATGLLSGAIGLRRYLRRRPRSCAHCGRARQRLGEASDDQHLTDKQRTEERLGSVDYDVWWCGVCRDALILRYGAFFSGYASCSQCSTKALSSSTTTLSAATEWSEGSEQVNTRCAHCGHATSHVRSTARLTRHDSSSSSSSGSSSSSSFGGGSSSGSGSSGSW